MEITLSKKYLQLKVLTIKNSVPVYSFHLNESGLPSSVLSKYGWQWDFGSRSFNSYLTPISTTSTSTSVPFSVDDVITKVYCYDNQYYEDGYSPYPNSGKVKADETETVDFTYFSGQPVSVSIFCNT